MSVYYAIVEGDPLDNGGNSRVVGGTQHSTIEGPDGRMRGQTHLGHKAWCSVCQSFGPILAGAAVKQSLRGFDMRLNAWEAVGGDIVICKCERHPRVVPVYARSVMYIDNGDASASRATAASSPAPSVRYDQRFHVTNPRTGQPLRDMPYRIVTDDGDEIEGRTDAQGYTQRIESGEAMSATLHVFEEVTPLNPDWDRWLYVRYQYSPT